MVSKNKEIEMLKIIYQEIIYGVSPCGKNYIHHLNELENINVIRRRFEIFTKYVDDGIPSIESRLKELDDTQQWTKSQEEEILSLRYQISDNEKRLSSIIPQQQKMIKNVIENLKNKLSKMLYERRQNIGNTAEQYAEEETLNYLLYLSIYKDQKCSIKLFDNLEDCESLEESEINQLSNDMDTALNKFTQETLSKIAVLPFFINSFSYCKDNMQSFLNKPVSELTNYQSNLFSIVARNINILQKSSTSPPELMDDVKLEDVIKWYDLNYQTLLGKRNEIPKQDTRPHF